VAAGAVAGKVLGHLKEDVPREVAPEDLGVGGGDLAALGNVPGSPHHRQSPVLEVVAGVRGALVVHDRRQREQTPQQRLVAAGAAGRLEGVRIEDTHDPEQLVHETAIRGGKVAEALGRLDDLPPVGPLRIRLHGVHQMTLLLAQVEDPHGSEDPQGQWIHLLLRRIRILGLPATKVLALRLVHLGVRAGFTNGQGAAMPAEESCLRQGLVAADAAAQLALPGRWSRDQGPLLEDELAGGYVPGGEYSATGHLRGADGPVGLLLAQIPQVGVYQLGQLLGGGVATGGHVGA